MEDRYGPEDIEQLLIDKQFSELLSEEKDYVLKHIKSEREYDQMRDLLIDLSDSEDPITPPLEMRASLLREHEEFHSKPSFRIWLNSLFSGYIMTVDWRRPSLQLAGVALLVITSFFFIQNWIQEDQGNLIVQDLNKPTIEEGPTIDQDREEADSNDTAAEGGKSFDDQEEEESIAGVVIEILEKDEISLDTEMTENELIDITTTAIADDSFGQSDFELSNGPEEVEEIVVLAEKKKETANVITELEEADLKIEEDMVSEVAKSSMSSRKTNDVLLDDDLLFATGVDIQRTAPINEQLLSALYTAW